MWKFFAFIWFCQQHTYFHHALSLEVTSSYTFRPFFLDSLFVIVVESGYNDVDPQVYPFGESDAFILAFGDEGDRDYLLSQEPDYIYENILQSQCVCSRTLILSLAYLDIFLGGESGMRTECQNFVIHHDDANNVPHRMEVYAQNIIKKLFLRGDSNNNDNTRKKHSENLYFVPIGFPQHILLAELNSDQVFGDIPAVFSEGDQSSLQDHCSHHTTSVIERLFIKFLFSAYSFPQCPYPTSYCCFLQQHQFSEIAQSSRCAYHPDWLSSERQGTSFRSSRRQLTATAYTTTASIFSPTVMASSDALLKISMTGHFFYLEEKLQTLEQAGTPPVARHQQGQLEHNLPPAAMAPNLHNFQDNCFYFPSVGLVDFVDFGVDPIPSFRNLYIHNPAPPEVVGHAHFAALDALGAYLQSGELFVHFASSTPPHRVGFQTAEDVFESSLTMYFEASSFGLGLNDSKSLAPPLRIHALPSPLSTASASTPLTSCKCDHVATGVHYLLGVINNPFFGHVLANTLSNLFATLYLKRIDPKDVTLYVQLERIGHHQEWEDKYYELFYALGIKKIHVNDPAAMLFASKYMRQSEKYCLERVLVGATPALDNLNHTMSRKTGRVAALPLWRIFGNVVANAVVSAEQKKKFIDPLRWERRQVKAPLLASTCAVTFIARNRHVDAIHSRGIRNLPMLEAVARAQGCTTQVLFLHRMAFSDQVAQLRYNTSLLVGVDGTGLLNAVWMHECASVLRINLWRKGGVVSKLAQGPWFEFNPKHNETVIYPNQLSFDPEARDSSEDGRLERRVETHFQTYGAVLHTLKEMVYADHDDVRSDQDQALRREFNFSGSVSGFSDIKMEDFFREGQSTFVNPQKFRQVLLESESYRSECISRLYD